MHYTVVVSVSKNFDAPFDATRKKKKLVLFASSHRTLLTLGDKFDCSHLPIPVDLIFGCFCQFRIHLSLG